MFKISLDKAYKFSQIILFSILIGYALILLIQYFAGIIGLLIAAGLIAFLSHEMITPLVRKGVSVNGAMAIVYTAIVSTIVLTLILMIPVLVDQVTDFISTLPQTVKSLEATAESFIKPLEKYGFNPDLQKISARILESVQASFIRATSNFPNILINGFSFFISAIIVIVISIYLVKDFDEMWAKFLKKTGPHSARWEYVRLELTRSLRGFVKGQLFSGMYMLVTTTIIYLLIGLKFGVVAGVTLGLLETIPYFGAFIGMLPVAFLALSQSFTMFLLAIGLTIVVQQIKDNVLYPRWMSDSIGIHPLGVFLSILIGSKIAGILGIFLAIPIAGLVQAIIRVIFSEEDFEPIVEEALSHDNHLL